MICSRRNSKTAVPCPPVPRTRTMKRGINGGDEPMPNADAAMEGARARGPFLRSVWGSDIHAV
eukprot:3939585-Pleurochrysis_carterae.AAC.2